MTIAELLPKDWLDVFAPDARRIGAGLDVATTTGGKSNPSALAFTQEGGLTSYVRLLQRFKTSAACSRWCAAPTPLHAWVVTSSH